MLDLPTLRYLQEVGYSATVLDVKSQRVRTLLGLAADSPSMLNGAKPSSPKDGGVLRYAPARPRSRRLKRHPSSRLTVAFSLQPRLHARLGRRPRRVWLDGASGRRLERGGR